MLQHHFSWKQLTAVAGLNWYNFRVANYRDLPKVALNAFQKTRRRRSTLLTAF